MPKPIERHGHRIDDAGHIHYDESPVTWDRIDALAGRRMDRRKSYAIVDGKVCSMVRWTARCSGCSIFAEGKSFGCEECGYHGVVRNGAWVPESMFVKET